MPIKIIKRSEAPQPLVAEEVVVEPHCDFETEPNDRNNGYLDGTGLSVELYRCKVCKELWREPAKRQGKPLTECEMWRHLQAKAAKLLGKHS